MKFIRQNKVILFCPPGTEENADTQASGVETGSASDTASGEPLSERDEEIRKISDMQSQIPYKKRKNNNVIFCSSFSLI